MKTIRKRVLSLFTAMVMICSLVVCLPSTDIHVSADNTPDSLVAIAEGEIGNGYYKYTSWFGSIGSTYQYAWCATFVSWCMQQAGCEGVVSSARCTVLYNNSTCEKHYVQDGAENYAPRRGDIIFFDWDTDDVGFDHVAIVYDYNASTNVVSFIDGNGGSGTTTTRKVRRSSINRSSHNVQAFMRPNYKNVPKILPTTTDDSYVVPVSFKANARCDMYDCYGNKEYDRYTDPGDSCVIDAVYTNGYVHIEYPASEGRRWTYAKFDDFSYALVKKDSQRPEISNVQIKDISTSGYTVTCTVTDNVGIDRVQFPTWTLANDQDDIQPSWNTNPSARGTINENTVTYRVNISDHNNEHGIYRTHIYAYDTSGNWRCVTCDDVSVGIGSEMTTGAGQTIPDGDYIIVSELGRRIYLDIPEVAFPAPEGIDVAICEGSTLPGKDGLYDTWTVKYLGNGYYQILQNEKCGLKVSLDVKNDSKAVGADIMTHYYHGGNNQQWSIAETSHGYTIQSRSTSWYLDVRGGYTTTGTKVQTCFSNGGKAQSWGFIPVASDDRPIADGEYNIKSACII